MSVRLAIVFLVATIAFLASAASAVPLRVLQLRTFDSELWLASTDGLWQLDASGKLVKVWRLADGLPSDVVTDVAADAQGHLWVATIDGIAIRQGETFVARSEGLPSTDVTLILPTRGGALFAGTGRGIARWQGERWERWLDVHQFGRDRVLAASEGADGRLWFAKSKSLTWIEPDGEAKVIWRDPLNPDRAVPLLSTAVHALAFDASGRIWLASDLGLSILNEMRLERHWQWRAEPWGRGGLPGRRVWSIFHDREGGTWLTFGDGADLGRIAYRPAGVDEWRRIELPSPQVAAYVFAQDAAGVLWLGTSDGLYRREPEFEFKSWTLERTATSEN